MEHRSLAPDLVVSDDNDAGRNQCAEELAPNVAQEELREEKQVGGPVNCSDSELSIYLQALAEGFLVTYYSDTSPSVQSKSMSIASKSYQRGKKMVVFHGFPSFQMSRNSTGQDGMDWSIASLAGFRARTFQPPAKAQESTASAPDFGDRWRELSVRYDRDSCSWRTHRSLWDEDLPACSLTLPTWGLMLNGALWERRTWEHLTTGNDAGLWPTPRKQMTRPCKPRLNLKNQHKSNLEEVVALEQGADGGRLNPMWVEWLMGWPIKWTDSQPLETDKFRQWLHSHGASCHRTSPTL